MVDEGGTPVPIALPFRGIALATNSFPSSYLEDTQSPELLVYAGKPSDRQMLSRTVMSWVYPEVLKDGSLWNTKLFRKTDSPYIEIETLLAYDPSVYIGCGAPPDLVRRVGLPAFNCGGSPALRQRRGLPDLRSKVGCGSPPDAMRSHYPESYLKRGYYSESYLFPDFARFPPSSAIPSPPKRALTLTARLLPTCSRHSSLRLSPAVLAVVEGEEGGNFPRAGIMDARVERKIAGDDAEQL